VSVEATAQLCRLEKDRCSALFERDERRLREIVAPEVIHVHGTGLVQRGDEYFAHALSAAYRVTERSELEVDVDGDFATMLGPITTTVRQTEDADLRRLEGIALQVWRLRPRAQWQQVTFQFTVIHPS